MVKILSVIRKSEIFARSLSLSAPMFILAALYAGPAVAEAPKWGIADTLPIITVALCAITC